MGPPRRKITASIETGRLRFDANSSRVSLSVEDTDNRAGEGADTTMLATLNSWFRFRVDPG